MSYYEEGFEAFQSGLDKCPYRPNTAGWIWWNIGWRAANAFLVECVAV